jgi:hypothetical protein
MLKEAYNNKDVINEFYNNTVTKENFKYDDENDKIQILSMSIGLFVTVFLINIVLFFYSIILIIQEWNNLDLVIQILSLFFILAGMPIISIIIILMLRKKNKIL